MADAFFLVEVVLDESEQPADVLFVEANAAATRLVGADWVARRLSEVRGPFEPSWLDTVWRVARDGGGACQEIEAPERNRWYEACAVKVGEAASRRAGVILNDITARKAAETALHERESRHEFLLALGDRVRELVDAQEIADVAAEMLCRHLGANAVAYGEVDPTGEWVDIWAEWSDGTVPSVKGRHRFDDYGVGELYRQGRVRRANDLKAERAARYRAFHIRATIGVPTFKAGRLVAVTAAHSATPREWTDAEVELVQETADRIWAAVEGARAIQALRESEERFRAAVEHAGFIPAEVDTELRYRWMFNPHPDFDPSLVVGKRDDELEGSPATDKLVALKRRALDMGDAVREEIAFERSDGLHAYDFRVTPVRAADGSVTGLSSVAIDVTEHRRLERELGGERELLQTIYDTIPIMLTIYDPRIETVLLNKHVERVTGWTQEDTARRSIMELAYPDPDYRAEVAAYMQSLQPGFRDIEMLTKDGRTIDTSWANVAIPDGRQVGIGLDVTEQKRAQEALRERARELEALNRTNQTLLREVNHRVKNNLSAILGLISAEEQKLAGGDATGYGDVLRDLGNRVRSLATVHGILSAGGWSPMHLDRLAREIVTAAAAAVESEPGLSLEIEPSPIKITPEQAHHLALVLGELVMNSAKYGCGRDRLHLRLRAGLHGDKVVLTYSDAGVGYPSSVLRGKGHSLGLWLVDAIVTTSLQGEWSIRNEGGAVTEVRFPAHYSENGGQVDG